MPDVIILGHPWLLLLLPVPILLHYVLPPFTREQTALRVPWFRRMSSLLKIEPSHGAVILESGPLHQLAGLALWAVLVLAMARPQFLEEPVSRVVPTRDMMLLVDLSGSMEAKDFTNSQGEVVDRLTAVKEVLAEFLSRREGDRVGLIVFGNAAFVQIPFTQDLEACRILLNETTVRMAGPRTAFGDAIGLGITLFQRSDIEERMIIALTDGNDTGSKIPPQEAAKVARDNEVTIHVIGVGDPQATGEEELDEEALEAVAKTTGGNYFHAGDREQLEGIYRDLDDRETRIVETESYRPRTDLFHWPLAVFVLGGLIYQGTRLLIAHRKSENLDHG